MHLGRDQYAAFNVLSTVYAAFASDLIIVGFTKTELPVLWLVTMFAISHFGAEINTFLFQIVYTQNDTNAVIKSLP